MALRDFAYQYDTNPRKIEYDYGKKKKAKKATRVVKSTRVRTSQASQGLKFSDKARIVFVIGIVFSVLYAISYRNATIDKQFAELQKLKKEVASIEKENSQLEINIQNSINLNNLENAAKETLGMQKLSSKQTVYISLPKKDYIEPSSEEVIIEESKGIFETVKEKILNIF